MLRVENEALVDAPSSNLEEIGVTSFADTDLERTTTILGKPFVPAVARPRQHHIEVCISRQAFFENIQFVRESVAPSKVCVVMKANAYGHGLAPLAPVAVAAGADYLGVCTNPEAAAIRAAGIAGDDESARILSRLSERADGNPLFGRWRPTCWAAPAPGRASV